MTMEAAMRHIAFIFVAAGLVLADNGIRPRGSAADYPAHATNDGVTIAAAVIPPGEVRKRFAADLNGGGYIVVEVAVYPESGREVDLSSGDFMLSGGSESSMVYPVSARSIAGVLDRKNSPRHRDTDVIGTVGYETGTDPITGRRASGVYTGVGVANGPAGTLGPSPPTGPDPWTMERELDERSLPEGKITQPVAGCLYFPKLSKKSRNAGYELTYYNANSKVRLLIPAAK
jgi:hypothetical protein